MLDRPKKQYANLSTVRSSPTSQRTCCATNASRSIRGGRGDQRGDDKFVLPLDKENKQKFVDNLALSPRTSDARRTRSAKVWSRAR